MSLLLLCSIFLAQDPDPVTTFERTTQRALERAAPSVVAIKVDRDPEPVRKPPPRPRFPALGRQPHPFSNVFSRRPPDAWCSGTIVEADGTILTTYFNVSGKVKSIKVRLADGPVLPGELLGYNGTYDLAAIKIKATGLPTLKPARTDEIKTGKPVFAVGRAPDGRGVTINPGIVSAPSRLAGRGIQIDAWLNFGNVGGPLVDTEGRLVAITCKVDTKFGIANTRGQNSGIGFAITRDRLADILPDLKAGKNVAEPRRPFLGVQFKPDSTITDGVELEAVEPGSSAETAGIKAKDVILEFDGKPTRTFEELRAAIRRKNTGDRVTVKLRRGEKVLNIECELGWRPGE